MLAGKVAVVAGFGDVGKGVSQEVFFDLHPCHHVMKGTMRLCADRSALNPSVRMALESS